MSAQYIIKEHIEQSVLAGENIQLSPGRWVTMPENHEYPFNFGLYITTPNSLYLMPYIKTDSMRISLYSKSYDKMIGHVTSVNNAMNAENQNVIWNPNDSQVPGSTVPQEQRTIAQLFWAENLKLLEISSRIVDVTHNEFIEGTEYFVGVLDIMIEYGNL